MQTTDLTDYTTLRKVRDFLSTLLSLQPDEATDLLTHSGEEVLHDLQKALGTEAFVKGESVLASPVEANTKEFMATVVGIRIGEDGKVLFQVRDQEDDGFDCLPHELSIDARGSGIDITPILKKDDDRGLSEVAEVAALQKVDWSGEHSELTRSEWRLEVGEHNTQLGYWQWLESRLAEKP